MDTVLVVIIGGYSASSGYTEKQVGILYGVHTGYCMGGQCSVISSQ